MSPLYPLSNAPAKFKSVFACSHRSHCPCASRLASRRTHTAAGALLTLSHRIASHRLACLSPPYPLEQRACEARECLLARIARIARIALAPCASCLASRYPRRPQETRVRLLRTAHRIARLSPPYPLSNAHAKLESVRLLASFASLALPLRLARCVSHCLAPFALRITPTRPRAPSCPRRRRLSIVASSGRGGRPGTA